MALKEFDSSKTEGITQPFPQKATPLTRKCTDWITNIRKETG